MNKIEIHLEAELKNLKEELRKFISFFEAGYDYDVMIYSQWDGKDILGHITFWHESFARNISDLGNGRKPNPLKGKLSEVNLLSVESTKSVSIHELIIRLRKAQKIIEQHICNERIDLIPYKKGSRDYSRIEHLEVVAHHIRRHLNDLIKKYDKTKK